MRLNRYTLILLVVLLAGLFFRVYGLGDESLWLDEGIALRLAHATPLVVTIERAFNNHPPVYFLTLHYWIKLFGDSLVYARFLSVIFGVLTILMFYILGRRLFNERVGVVSAFLLAISTFHIYYSQEARMYTMVAFLSLVSMYLLVRLFEKRTLAISAGYILSSFFLLYTHYSALLIILTQNVYFIAMLLSKHTKTGELSLKGWLKLQAVLIILYLPWVQVGVRRFSGIQKAEYWIPQPSGFSIFDSFREYAGSTALFAIFIALVLFFLVLLVTRLRINVYLPAAKKVYLLLMWLLIPIGVPFVISKFSASLYVTKYAISSSLAFYLLVALGIDNIKHKYFKFLTVGVIIALFSAGILKYYTETSKLPFEEVGNYINENAKRGDLIIYNDIICKKNALDHYVKKEDMRQRFFAEEGRGTHVTPVHKGNVEQLWQLAKGYRRVWIILIHAVDHNFVIRNRFTKDYELSYHKTYHSRSHITHEVNNFLEVFLIEKR